MIPGLRKWLMRASDVCRPICMKVSWVVFVVLFVVGLKLSLAMGVRKVAKGCYCDAEDNFTNECCSEGGDTCPGQCACGIFRSICKEESRSINDTTTAALVLLIIGILGFIGASVCCCCMCCCEENTSSRVMENQLAQPHTVQGAKPGQPVSGV